MKTLNLLLALFAVVALPVTAGTALTPAGASVSTSATVVSPTPVPKVVFQINVAEDAPTILRFVTNYLISEPTARVAVVSYGPGIDFMLKDAKDPKGAPYEPQLAVLKAKGVEFKVCNNTLKARNVTADVVSKEATVVPGAVNEILRLQTREGYAYFQH